ncbi:Inherit from COG: Hemolysin-type calcium-binding [Seminavis robusta]|uniref:Inherit from COG: Hemolysin-type calcium-binding n=1 Tax=Seminavis robusta TaxID=568900 RepID=A0A9N8HBG4_9STRA|nr:Inherit from COG: Hemolysin-type calcium-binding [Seminavis robusta]|eukprot:Sro337_g120570.1 Inherit from COG: Hemolysin-type calcium-binding (970) ;mRNA; r:24395-27304
MCSKRRTRFLAVCAGLLLASAAVNTLVTMKLVKEGPLTELWRSSPHDVKSFAQTAERKRRRPHPSKAHKKDKAQHAAIMKSLLRRQVELHMPNPSQADAANAAAAQKRRLARVQNVVQQATGDTKSTEPEHANNGVTPQKARPMQVYLPDSSSNAVEEKRYPPSFATTPTRRNIEIPEPLRAPNQPSQNTNMPSNFAKASISKRIIVTLPPDLVKATKNKMLPDSAAASIRKGIIGSLRKNTKQNPLTDNTNNGVSEHLVGPPKKKTMPPVPIISLLRNKEQKMTKKGVKTTTKHATKTAMATKGNKRAQKTNLPNTVGRKTAKGDKKAVASSAKGQTQVHKDFPKKGGRTPANRDEKAAAAYATPKRRRTAVIMEEEEQHNTKRQHKSNKKNTIGHVKPMTNKKIQVSSNATSNVVREAVAAASVKASQHATEDDVCGGCRFTEAGDRPFKTCGYFANEISQRNNVSYPEALRILVLEQGNNKCRHCLTCKKRHKQYWRYDDAAPKILRAESYYLPSISKQWRIPASILTGTDDNQESRVLDYFSDPQNAYPGRRYLFEYNPSIIRLPADQKPDIPGEDPVYLASYRVSTQQNCFRSNVTLAMIGGSWDREKRPRQLDLLGLALLRSDLSIIHDNAVNIQMHFGPREDFRLFVLHGQIYVASYCAMLPLWVKPVSSMKGKKTVNGMFPSKLQVTVGSERTMCSRYWKDIDKSKNLNYFVDADNNTMVEMFPLPHVLHKVDPTGKTPAPNPENATRDDTVPYPSFYTMEEYDLHYRHNFFENPFSYARGGACCVPFTDPRPPKRRSLTAQPESKELRLGLVHVKTPHGRAKFQSVTEPNQYLSRFYAFEPTSPYKVVAMSGYFCLPADPSKHVLFGNKNDENKNPYLSINQDWNSLSVAGEDYRCPSIHFVTGMVEKADDPSRLIIAYGVNDCTSWFVEVSKAEVIDLLFRPPRIVKKKPIPILPAQEG